MGNCCPFLSQGVTHPGALMRVSLPWSSSSFASLDKGTGNETIPSKTRPKNQLASIWFSKTWNLFTKPGRAPWWAWEKPISECFGNHSIPLAGQLLPCSQPETAWLPRGDGLRNFHIWSSLKFLLRMSGKNQSFIFTLVLLPLQSAGSFSYSK